MIAKALTFLTNFLNNQMLVRMGLDQRPVIASSLINTDGSIADNVNNKIVISIINMEHETFMKSSQVYKQDKGQKLGKTNPPVYLNLYLLISANYDSNNYLEAVKTLSNVLSSLQANPNFTKQNHPEMESPLTKLTLEIFNIPLTELSNIWSGIGAKYVPSIVYKLRMITIQEDRVNAEISRITTIDQKLKSK